jgi:perosamine synthetase
MKVILKLLEKRELMIRVGDLERKYVLDVLDSQFKTSKGAVYMTKFEAEFRRKFKSDFAISHVNGTATMHSVLEAAGIGAGDEVIVPPLTMSATALCVLHANATPIFADIDLATFNIDAKSIESKINSKTKAIITVALYGLSPDMDPIIEIVKKNNLLLVEDNAQAALAYYKNKLVGTFGDAASFSFQSSKHLSAGEGGVVTTNNQDLAIGIRKTSGLGYKNIGATKARISKDEIQHPSFERHDFIGWNYRMSELNCAVALAQTERAEELINPRKEIGKMFSESSLGYDWFEPQYIGKEYESSYWAFACKLKTEHVTWNDFRAEFLKKGGDKYYGAWQLSYNEPLFLKKLFRQRGQFIAEEYKEGMCPNAEYVQPRIKQFKTNYLDLNLAERQAEILKETLEFFN